MNGDSRLGFVQGVRGIAVLLVVFYHYRVYLDGTAGLGTRLFEHGAIGVDLFFAISGFIMVHTTRSLAGGPADALRFVIRRVTRVWPPYMFWTVVMWLLTRGLPNPAFDISSREWLQIVSLQPTAANGAAPFFGYPLLFVGWTLVFEMLFYLLFALTLMGKQHRHWLLISGFVVLLIAVPLVWRGQVHADALTSYGFPGLLAVATSPLMWTFLGGALIAHAYHSRWRLHSRALAGSWLALALAAVLWQYFSGYRYGHGLTRWSGPVLMLVLALVMYAKSFPVELPRALVWVGDVSFSLYLVHVIPTMASRHWKVSEFKGGGFMLACLMASLVAAYWSHRLLENGLCVRLRDRLLALTGLAARRVS